MSVLDKIREAAAELRHAADLISDADRKQVAYIKQINAASSVAQKTVQQMQTKITDTSRTLMSMITEKVKAQSKTADFEFEVVYSGLRFEFDQTTVRKAQERVEYRNLTQEEEALADELINRLESLEDSLDELQDSAKEQQKLVKKYMTKVDDIADDLRSAIEVSDDPAAALKLAKKSRVTPEELSKLSERLKSEVQDYKEILRKIGQAYGSVSTAIDRVSEGRTNAAVMLQVVANTVDILVLVAGGIAAITGTFATGGVAVGAAFLFALAGTGLLTMAADIGYLLTRKRAPVNG